jgi:competence protein ComEC
MRNLRHEVSKEQTMTKIQLNAILTILAIAVSLLLLPGCSQLRGLDAANDGNESGLTVYFIDVGQADSALVFCDGAAMLIDGGSAADSDLIYTFLKNHGVTRLDYIVATHAHEDHVGGLAGALNYATADVALCPVADYDSKAFRSFATYLGAQGVPITIPSHGDEFLLGSAEVTVVGPIISPGAQNSASQNDQNNISIVLKIVYGETSFLFAGDAERPEEAGILEAGYDISATVLKVGHHGSDTSTTYPFLREIMPEYAIISCGKGNSYGHPHENTLSRLRDADVTLYRTDIQGTVICVSDGETVVFTVERNADARTNPT